MLNKMKTKMDQFCAAAYLLPVKMCSAAMALVGALLMQASPALAAEKGNDYDFLKNGGDMFDGVNDAINKTTSSGLKFLRTLGYVLVFCTIVSIGIGFIVWRNPQESAANKKKILIVVLAAVLVFGVGSIASIVASIGDSL